MHRVAPPSTCIRAPVIDEARAEARNTVRAATCKPSSMALYILPCMQRALTPPPLSARRLGLPHSPDLVPQRGCLGIAIELFKQEGQTLGSFQVLAVHLQGALVGVNGWLVLVLLFVEHAALHVVFNLWQFVS